MNDAVRAFETGAVRDKDHGKLDLEGFLSPRVLAIFGAYMHRNRKTAAGFRDSDNWQKGIPRDAYMKSMWRHLHDVWAHHRGETIETRFDDAGNPLPPEPIEDALAGLMFNVMGYLFEVSRPEVAETPRDVVRRLHPETADAIDKFLAQPFGADGWCDCLPRAGRRCDCGGKGGGGSLDGAKEALRAGRMAT